MINRNRLNAIMRYQDGAFTSRALRKLEGQGPIGSYKSDLWLLQDKVSSLLVSHANALDRVEADKHLSTVGKRDAARDVVLKALDSLATIENRLGGKAQGTPDSAQPQAGRVEHAGDGPGRGRACRAAKPIHR